MSLADTPIALPASLPSEPDATPPVYTLFAVFRVSSSRPTVFDGRDVVGVVRELEDVVELLREEGVTLRGCYDMSGLRADADLMLWLHGSAAEDVQWGLRELRRTSLFKPLVRVWSALGVQRANEFSQNRTPAFVNDIAPKQWLALHPFTRSAGWHTLNPAERSRMRDEQVQARDQFPEVSTSTVAAFALGDYEWLLPFEADDLTMLVDMTRAFRAINTQQHVRDDTQFYTGRRIELAEVVEVLQ